MRAAKIQVLSQFFLERPKRTPSTDSMLPLSSPITGLMLVSKMSSVFKSREKEEAKEQALSQATPKN